MLNLSTDFTLGALTVVGVLVVHKIWLLLHAPPVNAVEQKCQKAMVQMGDDDKISVWGFDLAGEHKEWKYGISDDSCYVSRVESYLRLVKQPFVKKVTLDMSENPRGMVPFANIQGTMVDDSSRIIDALKNTYTATIDDHLTEEQKTTGYLIRQLLFGSLYWVLLHNKFETETGRKDFRENMSSKFPPVIRTFIVAMIFRGMNARLHGSGFGRMPHADIVKKGQADVRALSTLLGKKQFFFGDKPTSYDSDVYSWLVLLFYDGSQIHEPWVADIKKECSNLVEYTERMKKLLYPELLED
jgi:glutathione S-transferase